ncbi:Ig-like domain-containing protein [Algoriphagus sp. NG3]|uniref:Ig-like domain-containing protein n=1 Tax=Algoriphagus sp. NG3 TaxID=3097546 RepID=UPI002A81CEF6|nr:LamG-like jellyroll fold domain-containing protein [Algoriphagus sp. NG3]WPR73552.1 LamG-like jellyroll fold domain-containing protein [Algoriphagus sp. NG3]
MQKKNTIVLLYLFSGLIFGYNCLANSPVLSNSNNVNIISANFPDSIGDELDERNKTTASDPKDFIIRRKVDFDDHPIGYYTYFQFKSDWKSGNLQLPNTTQIRSVDGKKVLANYYPKGTWGKGGGLNQWVDFRDTPDDITEIYWTFRIKYQDDFDWGLGNKLPGVSFGTVQTVASGGDGPNIRNKGSSLRLVQKKDGKLGVYVYHHKMPGKYGDGMGAGSFGQLKKGQWQELTVRVVANQIGKSNGIMQVWLDGVLVASVQNIEMRTSASPQTIRGLALHTFMGGADARFAPDKNQFMWMDDIHYWQYSNEFLAENTSVSRGLQLHPASHKLYTPISGAPEEKPNIAPRVNITSPKANDQFKQGDNISITVDPSDFSNSVAKVDFYNGNTLLGTETTSPFSFVWTNLPAGNISLTAKATDSKGSSTVSAAVNIKVGDIVNTEPEIDVGAGLLQGLVAFYEMNTNSSGALRDSHGQNHGTNKLISHVNGFNEKGNRYDGNSSISSVPHSDGLNLTTEFTLMADIFRQGDGQEGASIIIGKTFSAAWPQNQAYSISVTKDNKIRIRTNTSGLKDWVSTQTVPFGKWLRVIATYKSGEGYSLYFDSTVPEKSAKISGTIAKSNQELTIGTASLKKNAANRRRFEGVLDNVGIWNRQLSKDEIARLITSKITYPDFGDLQEASEIRIISPVQNSQFDALSDIQIEIESENNVSKIEKVELFHGTKLITTLDAGTINYTWKNAPLGQYSIKARAFYDNGAFVESAPVTINVVKEENVSSKPETGTGLLQGLVAFYEMNTNSSGALRDSHGQNHGTNNLISHVNGFNEKGNRYDGNSSISSVPHSDGLNLTTEFTLMADIFRQGDGQESASIIMGKTFSAAWPQNQTYSMSVTKDNKIRIRTNTSGLKDWVSTQTVPFGKWVRVIATYKSGEGYSLYFDSTVPEKSAKISGTIAKSNQELTIGTASLKNNAANRRRFEGVLDNVGIWNRQLSQDEIAKLITSKITYPDFKGIEFYRITMTTATEEISGEITVLSDSTKAEAGEKLIFLVEEEEGVIFDHWSVDEVQVGNFALYELDMPGKDITLTKHFRTFVAPEISIVLPGQKSEFAAFSEVPIELEIKSNDAKIEKVELFNGEDLVGQLTQDSSRLDWKNIPEGNHQLVGRITDSNGKTYFSDPVVLKAVGNQSKDIPNVLLEYVIGPNPTTDYLNVIFSNLDGVYDFEFRIVSMNGVAQKSFNASPKESTAILDVSDLNNGVYVLHLIGNGHNLSSKKFIKL